MNKKILSLDAILLFLLVLVRVRIDTLAIAVIPRPTEIVAKVPILGAALPPAALRLLNDWMSDPVSSLLITLTFALTSLYLLLDIWQNWPRRDDLMDPHPAQRAHHSFYIAKMIILCLIIFATTGLGTLLTVGLRHVTEPARYAHDGGVLETESAIEFLLAGKNPYVEPFWGTDAEKLLPNTHGLSHYPYLPWSFLSSVPFYVGSKALLGWYDQRFVYLIALAVTLVLAAKFASRPGDKLALVMLAGLNPIIGNDIVYGLNDILAILWLVLAAYLLRIDRIALSSIALALAMTTKGTVWPVMPFYLVYLFRHELKLLPAFPLSSLRKLVPFAVTAMIVVLPFAFWDFGALVDDAWSYNMGSATVDPLPIKGWGITNVVLASGWVQGPMDPFPFWIFEALFVLPVLLLLLLRQWRHNTIGNMLLGYGLFLLIFTYFSRTMNANYLGYALSFVVIGYFAEDRMVE